MLARGFGNEAEITKEDFIEVTAPASPFDPNADGEINAVDMQLFINAAIGIT